LTTMLTMCSGARLTSVGSLATLTSAMDR